VTLFFSGDTGGTVRSQARFQSPPNARAASNKGFERFFGGGGGIRTTGSTGFGRGGIVSGSGGWGGGGGEIFRGKGVDGKYWV
jgi:hypothetical protein